MGEVETPPVVGDTPEPELSATLSKCTTRFIHNDVVAASRGVALAIEWEYYPFAQKESQ